VCGNSNPTDLEGQGFAHNFNLVQKKIFTVHRQNLYLDDYPFRKLLTRLSGWGYSGFCFAEIAGSSDPFRVMKYYRSPWLADQNFL